MAGFALEVVTPERLLVDTAAAALVLRTTEGDMTVLDGHTSLIAAVVPCAVRVEPVEGEGVALALHGGFLQIDTAPAEGGTGPGGLATRVTLLAGVAELATEIDVERARRAKEAAEAALAEVSGRGARDAEEGGPGVEETMATEDLVRADLRLEVASAPA
jgi:F-type H+-transporting ATPase subunit epsilon